MKDGLYHKDIFMPKWKIQNKDFPLRPSRHAEERGLHLPQTMNLTKVEIIEVELKRDCPVKVLVRMPYDNHSDICVAVSLENLVIKTAWLNTKTDAHGTLDKSKYVC